MNAPPLDNRRQLAWTYVAVAFALGFVPAYAWGQVILGAVAGALVGAAVGVFAKQQLLFAVAGLCLGAAIIYFALTQGPGFD